MVAKTPLGHLIDERDRLVFEMEALRNKIAGLDIAIKLVSAEPEHSSSVAASGKVRVSDTIVELLRESGQRGLKPTVLVELAAARGIRLNRGSVYTILNRMEHMGTVAHENTIIGSKIFLTDTPDGMRFCRRTNEGITISTKPTLAGLLM
jgi:hypothetical protein